MKKNVLFSTIFILLVICFSCNSDQKLQKNIAGNYYFSYTEEEADNMIMTIEGTETYNINGKVYQNSVFTLTLFDNYGDKISVKYDVFVSAKYEIKNRRIIYDYNLNSFKFVPQRKGSYYYDDYDLRSLIEDHFIPQMKQEMINDKGSKIVELTDKKMILESDGKQYVYQKQ